MWGGVKKIGCDEMGRQCHTYYIIRKWKRVLRCRLCRREKLDGKFAVRSVLTREREREIQKKEIKPKDDGENRGLAD